MNQLDEYKKLLAIKINRTKSFPALINMSWNNAVETDLNINDEDFDKIKEHFKNYKLSRDEYICGGVNDPTIEEHVLVEELS